MTTAIAPREERPLLHIVDDLTTWQETLDMLDGQLAEALPDDERAAIVQSRVEVAERLQSIAAALAEKTDDVAFVLRRMDHEYDYQDGEIDRMRAKREATDKARKWLRNYVVSVMRQSGMKQLKTAENTLFLRQTEAVLITDAAKVPAYYLNADVRLPFTTWKRLTELAKAAGDDGADAVRVKTEPSLSTIKKAIKSGVSVEGADLQINEGLVLR